MTIALGLVCSDGVLVASDSMGHSGPIATRVEKARALTGSSVVWAVSGSTFTTQRIEESISKNDRRRSLKVTPAKLADRLRPVVQEAYAVPSPAPGADSDTSAVHAAEALLLGWCEDEPSFVHLPADLAPVDCCGRSFVAIGSGHEFAAVVHATLRHQAGPALTLQQGMLLAYRIVATVCEVSSWGVALPVQIAVADAGGARVLGDRDLEEIDTGVQRWLASETAGFLGGDGDNRAPLSLPSLAQGRSGEAAG